ASVFAQVRETLARDEEQQRRDRVNLLLPSRGSGTTRRLRLGRDVQLSDPVTSEGEAPPQLGGPTREVALEAAGDEVLVIASAVGAEHLRRVLVSRGGPLPPGANFVDAPPGFAFADR